MAFRNCIHGSFPVCEIGVIRPTGASGSAPAIRGGGAKSRGGRPGPERWGGCTGCVGRGRWGTGMQSSKSAAASFKTRSCPFDYTLLIRFLRYCP